MAGSYTTDKTKALTAAFMWVLGALGITLGTVTVLAIIIGPLTGHWEPDIAVGFWLGMAAVVYCVYCMVNLGDHWRAAKAKGDLDREFREIRLHRQQGGQK